MSILEPGDVRTILPAEKLDPPGDPPGSPTVTLWRERRSTSPAFTSGEYYADGLALAEARPGRGPHQEVYFCVNTCFGRMRRARPLSPGHCRRLERRYAHDAV